jgi:raffinose/stachyose/melibiose transport system permease protein
VIEFFVVVELIYYMVVTGLKTREDWLRNQFGLPAALTVDNFVQALDQGRRLVWLRNSIMVTLAAVIFSTALAAYGIARFSFRGHNLYLNAMIALMVIPLAVLILPLFVLAVQVKLINTLTSVILFKGHFSINEPLIMAGTLIATLPMIVLYLFGQRYFIRGLVAGAVK